MMMTQTEGERGGECHWQFPALALFGLGFVKFRISICLFISTFSKKIQETHHMYERRIDDWCTSLVQRGERCWSGIWIWSLYAEISVFDSWDYALPLSLAPSRIPKMLDFNNITCLAAVVLVFIPFHHLLPPSDFPQELFDKIGNTVPMPKTAKWWMMPYCIYH